jgi:hypothetical protein
VLSRWRLTPAAGWPVILVGCLALAAVSLLVLPRSIAYDPYSWLIWGREIDHLSLNTRNAATAVKPLPIFINTILAPTGSLAPTLWLLIARAATLLSLALAFRLGRRLGGLGAGVFAAVGLAVSSSYLGYLFIRGMSEPMAVAAVLAAVDNHMQSRRRWALGCLVAAGLLRPEAWPFLIAYCFWLAYPTSRRRAVASAVAAVAVPASWFLIDWFGSRQFFRSAGAATHESQGGPLLSREPGLATLRETWQLMSAPVLTLFLLGLCAALLAWRRSGQAAPTVWFGLGALGWLAVDAVLAQGRFATGAPRYLLPGVALACVVGGVFVADVVRALARWRPDSRPAVAGVLVCLGVGLAFAPRFVTIDRQVSAGVRQGQLNDHIMTGLNQVIARSGGRDSLVRCGHLGAQPFQVPLVAWELKLPLVDVPDIAEAPGVLLQLADSPRIPAGLSSRFHPVGTAGLGQARWTVLTTCSGH